MWKTFLLNRRDSSESQPTNTKRNRIANNNNSILVMLACYDCHRLCRLCVRVWIKWHFTCISRNLSKSMSHTDILHSETAFDLWRVLVSRTRSVSATKKKSKTKISNFERSRFLSGVRMDGRRFYYTQFILGSHLFESRSAVFCSLFTPPASLDSIHPLSIHKLISLDADHRKKNNFR